MSAQGPSSAPAFRRRIVLTGLAGLAVAGTVGAFEHHRHKRSPRRQPDGQYRKLRLIWPHADTAPVLAVAYQKGFFARYSLDVEGVFAPQNGNDALDALVAGKADYAVAPALTWLPRLYSGLPASLVLGIQPGTFRLLVRRGANITRLDQLVGRTVAVPDKNAADKFFFAIMMRRKGINAMDGITWTDMPAEQMVDAASARTLDALVAHDPLAWQLLNSHPDLFAELVSSNTGHYADRTSLILGASHTALETDPDAATALTLALRDAAKWANQHRDEAATLVADESPEFSTETMRAMMRHQPAISPVTGHALRDQIAQYCDELQLIGLLPDTEAAADIARRTTRNVLNG
ncbi:ABC transporter substrate-binding protein [Acetobacter persici]|uniref:Nitrate ABC transporter substrate-binding protein n=1 Tax=Acetobacter persici TaxID=1076596 RepID=A0A1U9LGB8_9PROT|nr:MULTISPECIES: ABC transporter substrate-binding protein [Acetobacter]AQT05494.1 nitrate ABC transporter substrate-binding protein [Acetobacter persici]MBS1001049.1 ABC transporter substrate-binding protein [Acetobacter persici]MCG0997250.1 ABC transporter substrate-binding protein [Acetobacter persici]